MRKYHRRYEEKHAATKAPRKDLKAAISRGKRNPARARTQPAYAAKPSVGAMTAGRELLGMFPMNNPRVRNQESRVGIAEVLTETGLPSDEVSWQEMTKSTALPATSLEAFTQGVRYGMMTGIELCDINPFSKRSQLRREIYARLERSFSDADRAYLQRLVMMVEKKQPGEVRVTALAKAPRFTG